MNINLEDLLRQGINRLPEDVPAGITHRAAREARRHQMVTRAGVAVTATVAAAAVVIGVLSVAPTASKPSAQSAPPTPTATKTGSKAAGKPSGPRAAPTQRLRPLPSWPSGQVSQATLISRVEQSVLTSPNFIAYTRSYDYANRSTLIVSTWDYQNLHLLIHVNPHNAQLITEYPNSHTVKFVDFDKRTWWVTNWPFSGVSSHANKNQCVGVADDEPSVGDPQWAAWLVSSLRCGAYTVTSQSSVGGTPILTIVNTPKDVEYQYGVRFHMLVDATTYLPVAEWGPGPDGNYGTYQVITWLPPTSAALAQLALPTPPGFSHG
jgi:hypothetical protein